MARARRRKILGLGATLALAIAAIAIVLPMALASTVVDAGTLRLHLSGSDYFKYQLPGGTSSGQQTLGATNCELRSTGDVLASLSPTPSSAKVGLTSHGLGVKTSIEGTTGKCGEVNAPNEVLTLKIPSTGPLAGKHFDYAELDIEIHNGAPVNMALYDDGSQVDASPGNANTLNLIVNCVSSPSSCGPVSNRNYRIRIPSAGSVQFDEIRLWAAGSGPKSSIELEGGDAPWLPGGLGASLGTKDSVFHVIGAGPELSVTKTAVASPVSVGDQVGFDITVSNASGAGTASNVAVSDMLPAGLDWSIDGDPASDPDHVCSIAGDPLTLSCDIPPLAGGSNYAVRIRAATTEPGPVINDGAVVSIGDTTVATAGPASVEVLAPELSVTKTAVASPVSVGDQVGFDITVSNASGAGTASNVAVSDMLPAGLDWSIDGDPASDPDHVCSIAGDPLTLSCDIPPLAGGSNYAVRITATTTEPGTVTNIGVDVSIDGNLVATTDQPALADVLGTLGCTPGENDTAFQGGSGSVPSATLDREPNFDGSGCVLVPFTLNTGVGDDGRPFVDFGKNLGDQTQAQFYLTINWAPETPQVPADPFPTTIAGRTTLVDFGTDPHPVEWCTGFALDENSDLVPMLPGSELWCLVEQHSAMQTDGTVQVFEKLYGLGDPRITR